MSFMRKIGSDDRPSPTIAVLAASTTPFASSTACCACSRETSVVALDFSPSSVPSMSLSSAGSLSTSVGFIESYSSAIGCVACTSASSALPSSRFCSSAQKWPSVSSSPAAKSTLSRSSDSTPPAPFANAAGAAAVAATTARASPVSAAVPAAVFTGRRPAPALIRGGLSTRSCYTVLRRAAARRRSRRRARSRPRSLAPWRRRRRRCAGEKSAVRSCLGGLVQAAEPGRGGRASREPAGRQAWQCGRRQPGAQPAASGSAPQTRPRQGRGPPGPVPVRRRRRLRRRKPCGVHRASPAVPLAKRPLSPAESARAVLRGGMRCAIKFSAHPAQSGARPAIAHRRPARCAGSQARRWQERASACGCAIGRAWTGRAAVRGARAGGDLVPCARVECALFRHGQACSEGPGCSKFRLPNHRRGRARQCGAPPPSPRRESPRQQPTQRDREPLPGANSPCPRPDTRRAGRGCRRGPFRGGRQSGVVQARRAADMQAAAASPSSMRPVSGPGSPPRHCRSWPCSCRRARRFCRES